jgi:hypothetical protein
MEAQSRGSLDAVGSALAAFGKSFAALGEVCRVRLEQALLVLIPVDRVVIIFDRDIEYKTIAEIGRGGHLPLFVPSLKCSSAYPGELSHSGEKLAGWNRASPTVCPMESERQAWERASWHLRRTLEPTPAV